jgi:hypothetical protein
MDSLPTVARQRAVMTTLADVIVAAAAGKSLRVAVAGTHPDEITFADQLTGALHARGRPCRCLPPKPGPATADDRPPHNQTSSPNVAVITSGAPGPDETDLCRVDIRLDIPAPPTGSNVPTHAQPEGHGPCDVGDDNQPDIVVDYRDPAGPVIRHIVPTLTPPPSRS